VMYFIVRISLFFLLPFFSFSVFADEYRIVTGLKAPVALYYEAIEKEAFKRIGHQVTQKHIPAGRAIQLTNDGTFDGDCCRIRKITKIYPNTVIVPESVFTLRFTAFTKGDNLKIKQWSDIKPYNVAGVEGFKLIQIKSKKIGPKSYRNLPDSTAMFKMLDAGRIDIALLNYVDAKLLIKKMGLKNINATLPALSAVPVYLTLNKKNTHLVEDLTKALKAMKADGTYDRINQSIFNN